MRDYRLRLKLFNLLLDGYKRKDIAQKLKIGLSDYDNELKKLKRLIRKFQDRGIILPGWPDGNQ